MLETRMTFNTKGFDHSLDFVKGFAIICILLNHSLEADIRQRILFHVWGLPAVPLFLLIQTFHFYKKGFEEIHFPLLKLWTRVIRPFLIVEFLIAAFLIVKDPTGDVIDLLKSNFYWGGTGPGSYYVWIYLQFAIILPMLIPLFRRVHGVWLVLTFLIISISAEVLCSVVHVPDWVYRLLAVRYIFLIYLGYILVVEGALLNWLTLLLSVVSLGALFCFEYNNPDCYPFFFQSDNWRDFHWICYFYIAFPLMYLLAKFFYWLPPNSWLENIMCKIGHHSFAIYIFQMFYFVVIAPYVSLLLGYIGNDNVAQTLYFLMAVVLCVVPVGKFVSGKNDMQILYLVSAMMLGVVVVVLGVMWQWRPFYQPAEPIPYWQVKHHNDDRLVIVGRISM